jgi:hypothetical protein
MRDVARLAGVARSTVPLALRNDRSIPPATRRRIFAAAQQLGYRTNPLVSALMTALHARRTTDRHTVLAYVTSDPEFAPWRTYQMSIAIHEGARPRPLISATGSRSPRCGYREWGDRELPFYTADRRENTRVESGCLIIEARRERWGDNDCTTARLVTKHKGDGT